MDSLADLRHLALKAALGLTTQEGSINPIISGLMILSGLMCLIAVGFLLAATSGALYRHYDAPTVQLYMGLIFAASAVIIGLSAYFIVRIKQQKIKEYQKILAENIHQAFDAISEELGNPIRDNPKTAAIIAAFVGYVAGQKMH